MLLLPYYPLLTVTSKKYNFYMLLCLWLIFILQTIKFVIKKSYKILIWIKFYFKYIYFNIESYIKINKKWNNKIISQNKNDI